MDAFLFSNAVLCRSLSDLADYAVIILDTEGEIEAWNEGARALTPHEAGDVIGQHFAMFHPPEARAAGGLVTALAKATGRNRVLFASASGRLAVEERTRTPWLRVVKRYADAEGKEAV